MSMASDPENAIRRYLIFLEDPARLRDEAEMQRRTVAVLEASDPIEKLKALAALEKASAIDQDALCRGFVDHARAWAESHGVSVRAFRELGVPADVLTEAGFEVPPDVRRRSPRLTESASASAGGSSGGAGAQDRRRSVSSGTIKDAALGFSEPFTIAGVMAKAGGSPLTVRKAIEELVAEGRLVKQGPVPGYAGRGRAPIQYAVASW